MRKYVDMNKDDGWHTWFAWYPVYINLGDGHGVTIWWEKIQRKQVQHYDIISYYRNLDGSEIKCMTTITK